jgi:Protein of unknown function (DUF1549)/Protein of unknown function (DUF1553)/Planctomycete cytochrome C
MNIITRSELVPALVLNFRYRVLSYLLILCCYCSFGISFIRADDKVPPTQEQLQFFESRIRPVLVEHCYECHSLDAAANGKLRGQLRLDSSPASLRGGESGPAVVPGKPDESLLLSALRYEDFQMPPKGQLPAQVVKDFESWIAQGAADPRLEDHPTKPASTINYEAGRKFWSFQPLVLPPVPEKVAANNAIDSLVMARQAQAGVTISPYAPPRVLVRRAWLDLLGIPPTPQELQLWVERLTTLQAAAPDPEIVRAADTPTINLSAWNELIAELLNRPQYGERWARHWMDVARFAESYGYEQDYDRTNAYHYRDFLIRAFNNALPYNQFVQWQIAGDELAPDIPDAWMATGFLSAGAFPTQLTEDEFESARYDELDDMVSTTTQAFMGLSVGCARCHDHKFDPISAEDYYGLASVFTTAIRCESKLDLDPEQSRRALTEFQQRVALEKQKLAEFEATKLPAEFQQWLKSSAAAELPADSWELLSGQLTSGPDTSYHLLADGSYLAQGPTANKDLLTFRSNDLRLPMGSLRIEALTDPSLPRNGPGRAGNGNFALGNIRVNWHAPGQPAIAVKLKSPRATHQQDTGSLAIAASIDDNPVSGWAVDGQIGQNQAAVLELELPPAAAPAGQLEIALEFNHPNPQHCIGRVRLSVSSLQQPPLTIGFSGPAEKIRTAIDHLRLSANLTKIDSDPTTRESWQTGLEWFKQQSPEWLAVRKAVEEIEKQGPPQTTSSVQVTSEGLPKLNHHANDRGFPHFYPETYLLRRGDVQQRVRVAEPAVPRVLKKQGDTKLVHLKPIEQRGNHNSSYRRAALAEWITDTQDGAGALAARVMANRVWQHHFGVGLVGTANDFGAAGERPTHPELLEWLACSLVAGDWKLKALHHQIMTSRTYMQTGRLSDDPRAQIDPTNELLWHRPSRRLEAEAIRDSILSVSELLDTTLYGPGSLDPQMKRRSVYFFIKRSQLIQPMMLLDWPEHLVSIGRRQVTTIAPQSLQFMNAEWVRAGAVGLAARTGADLAGSTAVDDQAIERAVRQIHQLALSREISHRELAVALDFVKRSGHSKQTAGIANPMQTALTDYCQTIFCLSEFIYVD